MSFFRSFSQVLKKRPHEGGSPSSTSSQDVSRSAGKKSASDSGTSTKSVSQKRQARGRKEAAAPSKKTTAKQDSDRQEKVKAKKQSTSKLEESAKQEAKSIVDQAQDRARQVLVEAKSEALKIKSQAEKDIREFEESLKKQQSSLDRQLASLNNRLDQIEKRENQLDDRWSDLEQRKQELDDLRQELIEELSHVASYTQEQAKQELLERLERQVDRQATSMVAQKVAQAEEEADKKAQEILMDAMKHGATDYVVEYTMSSVQLPNADMKGRIIGREGRNIRAFERVTGVDIDLDESDEIRLSSFDPVRREVARQALERLMKDGRIQPSRIEEVVNRVQQEMEKTTFEEGKRLAHRFNIYDLPKEVLRHLGKFKYRFSYGQNMIHHVIETTQMGRKLAQELNLDVRTVTLGCLLHDIGKVIEGEGSHVQLGVQFLRRHKLPEEVIACVAEHHEDEPFSSSESVVVHLADAISGARPGARNENREEYVQRLSEMEDIALAHEGVNQAFAIQAGRELRVILNPDKTADRDIQVIAQKIAQQIQEDMQYPGTVTVNTIRELRASAKAS